MRVTFVVSTLEACSGVQRCVTDMANYWAAKGWKITVLTLYHGDGTPFFDLHTAVVLCDVGIFKYGGPTREAMSQMGVASLSSSLPEPEDVSALVEAFKRIMGLRQAIVDTAPQAVISFTHMTNIHVLPATRGMSCPVVVAITGDPYQPSPSSEGREADIKYERLRRQLYPQATYLVTPTPESLRYFVADIGDRGRAIPNPVLPPPPPSSLPKLEACANGIEAGNRRLIAMGRLAYEKGFDDLLHAFARVAPHRPGWTLEIWGEGPCHQALQTLINRLGLSSRAYLCGVTRAAHDVLRHADLFVVSSRAESFCNVLCEAMACGLAVVSFGVQGPRHIIRDGIDGVLVPPGDVTALGTTLGRLMDDETERQRLSARAPDVLDRFSLDHVMSMWEALVT